MPDKKNVRKVEVIFDPVEKKLLGMMTPIDVEDDQLAVIFNQCAIKILTDKEERKKDPENKNNGNKTKIHVPKLFFPGGPHGK